VCVVCERVCACVRVCRCVRVCMRAYVLIVCAFLVTLYMCICVRVRARERPYVRACVLSYHKAITFVLRLRMQSLFYLIS